MSLEKLALWGVLALVVGVALFAVGYAKRDLVHEDGIEKFMVHGRYLIPAGWLLATAGFAVAGISVVVSTAGG